MKPILLIINILVLSHYISFCQTPAKNLYKYWYYRDRMKYYVAHEPNYNSDGSPNFGANNVMGIRNYGTIYPALNQAEGTIYMGWYLGVLATEYMLLNQNNMDTRKTLRELYYMFGAFERLDKSEEYYPWYKSMNKLDGYYMQYDIYGESVNKEELLNKLNNGLNPANNIQTITPGVPGWVNEFHFAQNNNEFGPMTGDQSWHLLMGFALVARCVQGIHPVYDEDGNLITYYNFRDNAIENTDRIFRYIRNWEWDPALSAYTGVHGPLPWTIYPPDLLKISKIDIKAGLMYGITLACRKITGTYYFDNISCDPASKVEWHYLQYLSNSCDIAILAAIGDSWQLNISIPTSINTTYSGLRNVTMDKEWNTYYTLLWKFLNDKNKELEEADLIIDQINTAPCNGPYYYRDFPMAGQDQISPNGWGSSRKFTMSLFEQYHGQSLFSGNYTGLDYMLLYNLYHLVYNPTAYSDYQNYVFNGDDPAFGTFPVDAPFEFGTNANPYTLEVVNSITSSMRVDVYTHPGGIYSPGNVTYKAGNNIHLVPGFKVVRGAKFHAEVGPFAMCSPTRGDNDSIYENAVLLDSLMHYTPFSYAYEKGEMNDISFPENTDLQSLFQYYQTDPDLVQYLLQNPKALNQYLASIDNNDISDSISNLNKTFPVLVYPNPTSGNFNVSVFGNNAIIDWIEISDITGNIISRTNIGSQNATADISEYPKGIYFIKLMAGNQMLTKKVIYQ
jgi:hypothetical protein